MKKKQFVYRIVLLSITGACIFGAGSLTLNKISEVASIATITALSTHNEIMLNEIKSTVSEEVSKEMQVFIDDLNTQVKTLQEENTKLSRTIEDQSVQIDKMSKSLQKLGITFQ